MGLLFFNRDKFGEKVTMEGKLSPEDLQKGLKLEEHVSVYEDFMKGLDDEGGTYQFRGMYKPGMIVPRASTGQALTAAERVQRVRKRLEQGGRPLLLSIDPKDGTKIFHEEDREAFEDGYICENCVQFQSVPFAPSCTWLSAEGGCGFNRY